MARLSKSKLDKAKQIYLSDAYPTISDVSRQTGISRSTISHHVKKEGGWEYERNLARTELIAHIADAKKADFAKMTSSTITVLKRALSSLAERTDAPTINEAKGAAAILDILDKITRLDEGTATDIIASEKTVTVGALKSKLKLDPFSEDIKEVAYEEIKEPDTD